MKYPRVLRVAELARLPETAVRPAAGRLPRGVSVVTAELRAGTLVTLEWRRRWWDRRPRWVALRSLAAVMARILAEQHVVVVAAAIRRDRRVLVGQRSAPPHLAGCWEFPGGKVEPGETLTAALARECREELEVSVHVGDELARTTLPDGAQLVVFGCTIDHDAEPTRTEHRELRWVDARGLAELPLLPANAGFVRPITAWLAHDT